MDKTDPIHEQRMQLALREARKAGGAGEVPVGAVLVGGTGELLAAAFNRTIGLTDPTGHAEILALREAARTVGNYRLLNTTLYVTIEPCIMCMGALVHARVAGVIFGAPDPGWGGAGSLYDLPQDRRLNHRITVAGGVCAAECRALMQNFFRARRKR